MPFDDFSSINVGAGMPITTMGMSEPHRPKLMVVGHARHGKDTVCEMLRDRYGFTFVSSSMFMAENVIMRLPVFEGRYSSAQECYDDRTSDEHRKIWFDAIANACRPDLAAVGRMIYAQYDIYCGLRDYSEFSAIRNAGLFQHSIWVDGLKRLPPEAKTSMNIEPWMCDHVLDNNYTLEMLGRNLDDLVKTRIL